MNYLLVVVLLCFTGFPKGTDIPWQHCEPIRPGINVGYGKVVDDLESHATARHPMRNTSDVGNWVHELTHQVNSELRCATEAYDNAFYVFDNKGLLLLEPNIKLSQVARMVPQKDRGLAYKLYLIEQGRWWNDEPLYILDEVTAYTNSVWYRVHSGTKDDWAVKKAHEFLAYADALVKAVKKHDSEYEQMEALVNYVKWNRARVKYLTALYNGETPEPDIDTVYKW